MRTTTQHETARPHGSAYAAKRRRAPTRADLVVLLALALLIPIAHRMTRPAGAADVLVVRSARGIESFDAHTDVDIEIQGPLGVSGVRLADGEAWIERAPCRNRLCQRMGRLRGPGRSLVCIPNKLVVRFVGDAEADAPDAISH